VILEAITHRVLLLVTALTTNISCQENAVGGVKQGVTLGQAELVPRASSPASNLRDRYKSQADWIAHFNEGGVRDNPGHQPGGVGTARGS
jgi:hypothetical protein